MGAYILKGENGGDRNPAMSSVVMTNAFNNYIFLIIITIILITYTAKFNCSVPGTLHNFSQDCNVSTTPTTPTKITTDQSTVSTSITSTADGKSASDADAVVPVYVVAGAAAGGVFILTLCIISTSLCTFLGLRMAKRRQQFALTVYSQQNMHTVDDEQTQEVEHGTYYSSIVSNLNVFATF